MKQLNFGSESKSFFIFNVRVNPDNPDACCQDSSFI